MAGDSFSVKYENWSKDYPISSSLLNITKYVGSSFALNYAITKICRLSPLYIKVGVIGALFHTTAVNLYNVIGTNYGIQKHDVKAMEAASLAIVSVVSIVTLVALDVIGFKGACIHALFGILGVSGLVRESMDAQNQAAAAV